MARIVIEMDRQDGLGFRPRVECEADLTSDQVVEQLAAYAIQYEHRAFVDQVLVATAKPVRGRVRVMRA